MPITIQVPFKVLPKETPWNEVCAWAIEKFGLPNFERYKFGNTCLLYTSDAADE